MSPFHTAIQMYVQVQPILGITEIFLLLKQ